MFKVLSYRDRLGPLQIYGGTKVTNKDDEGKQKQRATWIKNGVGEKKKFLKAERQKKSNAQERKVNEPSCFTGFFFKSISG